MKKRILTWQIEETPQALMVRLQGNLNEDFAFKDLIPSLQEKSPLPLRLQLDQITRVNSMGIREWFNFLRALAWPTPVRLTECSTIFTQALSQIREMAHGCFVESCYLPVWCPQCEDDFDVKIELLTPLAAQKLIFPCPHCQTDCKAEVWGIEEIVRKQTG